MSLRSTSLQAQRATLFLCSRHVCRELARTFRRQHSWSSQFACVDLAASTKRRVATITVAGTRHVLQSFWRLVELLFSGAVCCFCKRDLSWCARGASSTPDLEACVLVAGFMTCLRYDHWSLYMWRPGLGSRVSSVWRLGSPRQFRSTVRVCSGAYVVTPLLSLFMRI